MKTLLITPTEIDFSYGGAARSGHIRNAMRRCGDVLTLIIEEGKSLCIDDGWTSDGVRRIRFTQWGYGPAALYESWKIRRWVSQILDEECFDAIVARYFRMAALVPRAA